MKQPPSGSSQLIDFVDARIAPGTVPNTYILTVSGTVPYPDTSVTLKPLTYVRQPEYWGIEVVGTLPGTGHRGETPYTKALPLDGVLGTNGVEVIGATV